MHIMTDKSIFFPSHTHAMHHIQAYTMQNVDVVCVGEHTSLLLQLVLCFCVEGMYYNYYCAGNCQGRSIHRGNQHKQQLLMTNWFLLFIDVHSTIMGLSDCCILDTQRVQSWLRYCSQHNDSLYVIMIQTDRVLGHPESTQATDKKQTYCSTYTHVRWCACIHKTMELARGMILHNPKEIKC